MASESEAVFFDRVKELDLGDLIPQLSAKGWTSQGKAAFATTYQPSQPDDKLLMEQFIVPLVGDEVVRIPALRRLWFEAYSAVMIEIKQRTAGSVDAGPRKLTPPELAARRQATAGKVGGLKLEGELEVSDELINAFAGMVEKKAILYIPIEKATKQELSIEGQKTDPHFAKGEGGVLKEVLPNALAPADVSTDLRVELAMQRLGLAADMGKLMTFGKHEELRLALQNARLEDPPQGYARTSLHQALRAHKEFWTQMAQKTAGKMTAAGGDFPCDVHVTDIIDSRKFKACLMFLPAGSGQPSVGQGSGAQGAPPQAGNVGPAEPRKRLTKGERKRKQLEQAADAARLEERAKVQRAANHQPPPYPFAYQGRKGDGKGKRGARVPLQLLDLGCVAKTPQGCTVAPPDEPICFAYNLPGGCPNAQPGQRCSKGLHVCAKCFGGHSATSAH